MLVLFCLPWTGCSHAFVASGRTAYVVTVNSLVDGRPNCPSGVLPLLEPYIFRTLVHRLLSLAPRRHPSLATPPVPLPPPAAFIARCFCFSPSLVVVLSEKTSLVTHT